MTGKITVCTHGPYLVPVNENIELLIIARHNITDDEAKAWDRPGEEKALKSSNGVVQFLENCLSHKKEVYHLIKELTNGKETKEAQPQETQQPNVEE